VQFCSEIVTKLLIMDYVYHLRLPNLKLCGQSNIKLVGMAYHMELELRGSLVPRPTPSFRRLRMRLTKRYKINAHIVDKKVHMDPFLSI